MDKKELLESKLVSSLDSLMYRGKIPVSDVLPLSVMIKNGVKNRLNDAEIISKLIMFSDKIYSSDVGGIGTKDNDLVLYISSDTITDIGYKMTDVKRVCSEVIKYKPMCFYIAVCQLDEFLPSNFSNVEDGFIVLNDMALIAIEETRTKSKELKMLFRANHNFNKNNGDVYAFSMEN